MDPKQERKEQWKAGLVALIVLTALALAVPMAGGAADWLNEANADHSTADTLFTELPSNTDTANTYDMDAASAVRASADTEPNSYYYFHNTSTTTDSLNKCNVTYGAGGAFTVSTTSTAGNTRLDNVTATTQDWPYWIIYFDYRAWDAYYDNGVRIKLNISNLRTGTAEAGTSKGAWEQTVTLGWGERTSFYSKTLGSSEDDLDVNIDLDVNEIRRAIMQYGQTAGYLKLKITKQSSTNNGKTTTYVTLGGSGVYSYSATNLVARDEPLGIGIALVGVIGFVGALLVQPNISLSNIMSRGPRQGKRRGR